MCPSTGRPREMFTEQLPLNDPVSLLSPVVKLPSTYKSPFVDLGEDIFRRILYYICGEPLEDVITTDGYRCLLPFAVCCKHHYVFTLRTIRGLSVLPLHFARGAPTNRRKVPSFSLSFKSTEPLLPVSSKNTNISSTSPTVSDPELPVIFPNLKPPTPALTSSRLSSPFQSPSIPVSCRTTFLDTRLPRMALRLPSLRVIRLFNNSEISDLGLHTLTAAAPQLEELRLRALRTVTVVGLESLKQCSKLRVLDLSYSRNLGDQCGPVIASLPCLQQLHVAYWRISDMFMETILQNKTLLGLCISSCHNITAHSFNLLAQHGRMEWLRLRASDTLSDESLRCIASCKSLKSVDVSFARRVTDDGLGYFGLRQMELEDGEDYSLNSLTLTNIPYLSDRTLHALATRCRNLRHLDISHCSMVTDDGIESLRSMENLESLDVSGCTLLTHRAVKAAASLPHLSNLVLARCVGLTDVATDAIVEEAQARRSNYLSVDLRHCFSVSAEALDRLEPLCKRLIRPRQ